MTLTQNELLGLATTAANAAVTSALEIQREEMAAAAQSEADSMSAVAVDREDLTGRLRRVKFWAVAVVTVISSTVTAAAFVYARGEQAQEAETHEDLQDQRIDNTSAAFTAHQATSQQRDAAQAVKIRHLGALQIEQGNDQRTILLESAPRKVAAKRKKKPDTLTAAEAAVLRD